MLPVFPRFANSIPPASAIGGYRHRPIRHAGTVGAAASRLGQSVEPGSKPRRSRRREEADGLETEGIRLLTLAATSFRKGFENGSVVSLLEMGRGGV
jgi:hypothetical protein